LVTIPSSSSPLRSKGEEGGGGGTHLILHPSPSIATFGFSCCWEQKENPGTENRWPLSLTLSLLWNFAVSYRTQEGT